MPQLKEIENKIFKIKTKAEFNQIALEIFHFQYEKNLVYHEFVHHLNIDPEKITKYDEIPFLPIEFFRSHEIKSGEFNAEFIFSSSGTSGSQTSKHFVKDTQLYQKSFLSSFEYFFGDPKQFVFLALLPSYLEKEGSSLIFMVKKLIELSFYPESGFYLNDYERLAKNLEELKAMNKKIVLIGVSYALLEMAQQFQINFPELILMETGGMKGRYKEIVRDELHLLLKQAFGVKKVFSEYGMTELLSQAYSKGNGIFATPPWMKVLIRDTNDPFSILPTGQSGGINIIDLANIYSCSFIATQDLGKLTTNENFEVLGRFDNSEIRGCNLLIN